MDLSKYKYKTELHAHTSPASPCSQITPERMIEAYSELGADAIVLTNHFISGLSGGDTPEEYTDRWLDDYYKLKTCGEKSGISVILGMEIRFEKDEKGSVNDYLIYGIDEEDVRRAAGLLDSSIDEFYEEFKNERNVILQAHPFRNGITLANTESIDGVEVFNMHPNHNSRVALAAKYAKEHNFIISGGTDFHHESQQGCCFIKTDFKPEDSFDIAKILKERNFVFDIFGNTVVPYNFA